MAKTSSPAYAGDRPENPSSEKAGKAGNSLTLEGFVGVLSDLRRKAKWGVDVASWAKSPAAMPSEAQLWILSLGLTNGIYSIKEQLLNTEKNRPDVAIKQAIDEVWDKFKEEFETISKEINRNPMTHQGDYRSDRFLIWHEDYANDTVVPSISTKMGSKARLDSIQEFMDIRQRAFVWWLARIIDIDNAYIRITNNPDGLLTEMRDQQKAERDDF